MGSCCSTSGEDQLLENNQPSDLPPQRRRKSLRPPPALGVCGGCFRRLTNAWTFDNFDLDLEGADWRFAFATSRFLRNGWVVLAMRFVLMALMVIYSSFTLREYLLERGGLKFWSIHFGAWSDSVSLLYVIVGFLVHARALQLAGTPETPPPAPTPVYITFLWLLYAIALPTSLMSLLLELLPGLSGLGATLGRADKREAPAVIMVCSLLLNNYSYHILHTVWPMVRPCFPHTPCRRASGSAIRHARFRVVQLARARALRARATALLSRVPRLHLRLLSGGRPRRERRPVRLRKPGLGRAMGQGERRYHSDQLFPLEFGLLGDRSARALARGYRRLEADRSGARDARARAHAAADGERGRTSLSLIVTVILKPPTVPDQ
jgi:hypothetical protein